MFVEYVIPHKHNLKILCKSKHILRRYNRKREWVFFFRTQCRVTKLLAALFGKNLIKYLRRVASEIRQLVPKMCVSSGTLPLKCRPCIPYVVRVKL